ncbi:hypothetical protein JCM3770_002026 [Rhodotorula araucariae]
MSAPVPSSASSSNAPYSAAVGGEAAPEPYFDRTVGKWMCEDKDGNELEWDQGRNTWAPALTDEIVKQQQAAYSVAGVDEEAPVAGKEDKKGKKRKAADGDGNGKNKKARGNTAVFVSSLPESTTVSQLVETFSKAGLILEDVSGEPKVKLYKDADGRFKGEALIVYLQEASVALACRLFDETELVLGSGEGTISVKEAQWDSKKADKAKEDGPGQGEGTSAGKGKPDQQKARLGKKAAALRQKLGDWSDDEDSAAAAARARKFRGVVVLEGMFTLKELEDDATLLLDLKEDVREECETIGEVTNVTLYDKEEKGVMTVRFKDELAAEACIAKMNGRFFGGRTVTAFPMDGSKKYKKSGQGADLHGSGFGDEDDDEQAAKKEEERLAKYADWLEKGGV